jgi:hypothetical protein
MKIGMGFDAPNTRPMPIAAAEQLGEPREVRKLGFVIIGTELDFPYLSGNRDGVDDHE